MNIARNDWLFSLVVIVICIVLWFVDIAKIPQAPSGIHARAQVITVDNESVRTHQIVRTGFQVLKVRLLHGEQKGHEFSIVNRLIGKLEFDEFYSNGDTILVEYDLEKGEPANGLARGHYRIYLHLVLFLLFALLLLAVGGITGFNALISFVFVALIIWKLFFPLLLKGFSPIPTGLTIVTIFSAVICLSVGGLNRRGIAAFFGSILGTLLICWLAILFTDFFHLNGAVQPFAEMLLFSGYYDLQLSEIFISTVFIASSGAVMDLAMDIAASMEEIKHKSPQLGVVEHIYSGLRVGRAVLGTMATTLLLAYSISHSAMFMFFMAKGLDVLNILNAPFISAEILNILVGSFGLVAVAPLTAIISGLLHRSGRYHTQ